MEQLSFEKYIKKECTIADIGCGPNGASWWDKVSNCNISAFDLYNKPENFDRGSNKIIFIQTDVSKPCNLSEYMKKFDVVVADHIFEHVTDPYGLALGCNMILKEDGLLHIGIPTGDNFTDRFYRLIHSDGGGHVVKYNKNNFLELMVQHGFELLEESIWEDDWSWLNNLYSKEETLNYYGVSSITTEDIKYIAEVFKKELTAKKGYFYGYEFLFKKVKSVDNLNIKKKVFKTKVRKSLHEKLEPQNSKLMEISNWATELDKLLKEKNKELDEIKNNSLYKVLKKLKIF